MTASAAAACSSAEPPNRTTANLLDQDRLIETQLRLTAAETITFSDGRSTDLTPVHLRPRLDDVSAQLTLDGQWRYVRWPFPADELALANGQVDTDDWLTVAQPGKVFYADADQCPSDVPDWDRVGLAHIDPDDGAMLCRTVRLPERWANQRIYLRFDSIFPAGRVYLNGQLLGEHLSGLSPVEFDVTDHVNLGRANDVALRLLRTHPKVKLDMVRHACEFAGLAQSAYFHATAACQVADYHLIADLDDDLAAGSVAGCITIHNHAACDCLAHLTARLLAPDGQPVGSHETTVTVPGETGVDADVAIALDQPLLWNDEQPHLYTVKIELAAEGQPVQGITYRTGFRKLVLSSEGCFLNGQPVKFRGVNHLTYHPQFGLHTPKEWLRENFALMKKANVNAIRTHFTCPTAAVDLCDEMGLYLIQELPIDWGTDFIHDVDWVGPIMMRLHALVKRDRHHPSLMVWSVGNENMPHAKEAADDGWHHLRTFDKFVKKLDPTRHTMFPPPGPANNVKAILGLKVGDIADTHYSFANIVEMQETDQCSNPIAWDGTMETTTRQQALDRGWSGTWFSSEYGILNAIPDLHNNPYLSVVSDLQNDLYSAKNTLQMFIERMDYEWGIMRSDPCCLGGAYFPWLCAGAANRPQDNPWGFVRWAEDADWGVVTADLLPKPFFWAMRTAFSPVQFPGDRVLWRPGDETVKVEIWNQYNQYDLADCTFRTMMGGGGRWMHLLREYRDVPIQVAPGRKELVELPIWNKGSRKALDSGSPICLRCIVMDPTGFRPITHDIIVIPEESKDVSGSMPIGPDAVF